jgi:exodeoxyribonuclease V alpha subunit
MIFLQAHDVSTAFGYRIYKQYGNESIDVVKKNPYQLADDIWGIGFQTADTIARKMGMDLESYPRCRAGVFYVLNRLADEGHCFAFFDDLSEKSTEILKIDNGRIVMTIGHLMNEKELISEDSPDGRRVYLPPFFFAESGIAKRIASILRTENVNVPADFDNALNDLQTRTNITYETTQITAIRQAIMSKFSVVTGGPGTGKTTITKAIISLFVAAGKSVLLAAPTGRAAKRLSEVAGLEAKTIHRLLEYKPPEGYGRKAENPLIGDVLILDECSMIDTLLMYNLLKAVPDSMTIVMAGDIDQLPSVGAGNVLGDIMGAKILPVTCLTHIFRQAAGSRIITNAHRINAGKIPDLSSAKNGDFFFIETEKDEALADKIVALCAKRLPKYYRANPVKDIQVMTPMRRGEAGADNLNRALQAALNPATLCLRRGASEYRLGDKVMQIRNNYDKLVFNGDIGIINHVDLEEKTLTVLFDERPIKYDILELDELVLSYAVTVHKSQGGEFPIVIMPVTFKHYALLQRNLLYTGVTRAKKVMVMLGEKSAVAYAVNNAESGKRNTALSERLRKVVR